ncbi:MAG: glycerol-3-phosphate 1-O-acyltransferase PlsY [Calditrichota bacterium]
MTILLSILIGFLIGGIPTGILLCRAIKGVDPRTIGSGSSGATNVSRVLGKKWALVVLVLDGLKGYLPVRFLAPALANNECLPAAAAAMAVSVAIGHIWTPYAGFRGGKGVAASAGGLIALDPRATGLALVVWLLAFLPFRYVSLASIIAAIAFPIIMIVLGERPIAYLVAGGALALLIIYAHRANISRILRHEEKRLF